jgi:prophage antirepressor-like protein
MNELAVFSYANTEVRTVVRDGEPWFVATDVCTVLGFRMASDALRALENDEKGYAVVRTPGGEQRVSTVSESGLYALIFRSRVPAAKTFRKWVTSEVLPAIRKTGGYEIAPAIPQTYADALQLAADQARQIEAQAVALAEAAPKVEAWDHLASAEGDYAVATAAKVLSNHPLISVGQRRLFTLLSEMKWIYRRWEPAPHWTVYQYPVDRGWLTEKPKSHAHPRTGELVLDPPQVRVTVKGLAELQKRLTGTQGEIAA